MIRLSWPAGALLCSDWGTFWIFPPSPLQEGAGSRVLVLQTHTGHTLCAVGALEVIAVLEAPGKGSVP